MSCATVKATRVGAFALASVLVACGGGASDTPPAESTPVVAEAPPAAPTEITANGAEVYATCTTCHQADGKGMPGLYPPLAESEWVNGKGDVVIAAVLHGVQGEITVKGEKYNGVMVPWGVSLDDNQVAAVVNYVRSSFGNSAPPVTLADVTRMREATKTRTVQYTEAELAALR